MYPIADVVIDSSIPANVSYWTPKPSEIDEEGFGYFRDVWPLVGARTRDVSPLIAWERRAAEYVARQSADDEHFEELARIVETYNPNADDNERDLPDELRDGWVSLNHLELGVSGLAHALSNAGFYPAASCRTHAEHSWSDVPVVLFASDRVRLSRLQPLAAKAKVGIRADTSRGVPLFAAYGRSILELMNLAALLFRFRTSFRALPKTERRKRGDPGRSRRTREQDPHPPTLF